MEICVVVGSKDIKHVQFEVTIHILNGLSLVIKLALMTIENIYQLIIFLITNESI